MSLLEGGFRKHQHYPSPSLRATTITMRLVQCVALPFLATIFSPVQGLSASKEAIGKNLHCT